METIHKSHSRLDLVELINNLNIPVIFSHSDNKKDICEKMIIFFEKKIDINFEDNVYKIKNNRDLQLYLKNENVKKSLSVKEKNTVMAICKSIISYCNNGYMIENSTYNDLQTIQDDMLYILQFGDIPSVRRACKLMNRDLKSINHYKAIISPQMEKKIKDKQLSKHCIYSSLIVKTGEFVINFD